MIKILLIFATIFPLFATTFELVTPQYEKNSPLLQPVKMINQQLSKQFKLKETTHSDLKKDKLSIKSLKKLTDSLKLNQNNILITYNLNVSEDRLFATIYTLSPAQLYCTLSIPFTLESLDTITLKLAQEMIHQIQLISRPLERSSLTPKDVGMTIISTLKKIVQRLPVVAGNISALPVAGKLTIQYTPFSHKGLPGQRLVAKREIDGELVKKGELYIRLFDDYRLNGSYFPKNVGLFETGDLISSRWYTPVFAVGKFIDLRNGRRVITPKLLPHIVVNISSEISWGQKRSGVVEQLYKITPYTRYHILRKLYPMGIDYLVDGYLKKDPVTGDPDLMILNIWSTYTGKRISRTELKISF